MTMAVQCERVFRLRRASFVPPLARADDASGPAIDPRPVQREIGHNIHRWLGRESCATVRIQVNR